MKRQVREKTAREGNALADFLHWNLLAGATTGTFVGH
jgi:hypothetical protein